MGGPANAAVEVVGRPFFLCTMAGLLVSALLTPAVIILGLNEGFFTWELDRCSCVEGAECVDGADFVEVDIGWQRFTFTERESTDGCTDAFSKSYSLGGEFSSENPTQADENNGAQSAGEALVAMLCVSSFFAYFTYTMVKQSYVSNGSHCTIGISTMARACFLVCMGTVAAAVSFWWLIEGRFGDEDEALATKLFDVVTDTCEASYSGLTLTCPEYPWELNGPGLAGILCLAQIGCFLITSIVLNCRVSAVEGILDGSLDTAGNQLKRRTVEVEMVVGKALATDGDPDYDSENPLYEGTTSLIRPYPLPKSAKVAKKAAVAGGADAAGGAPSGSSSTASSEEGENKSDPGGLDEGAGPLPGDIGAMGDSNVIDYRAPAVSDLEMIAEGSEEDATSDFSSYSGAAVHGGPVHHRLRSSGVHDRHAPRA